MIDLLNHTPSANAYDMSGNGIAVGGMYDSEVLVKYSVTDPIRRFFGYGFNATEPMGFSLAFQIPHREKTLVVRGGSSRSYRDRLRRRG